MPRVARDQQAIGRFEREIEDLGRLEHANVVRATDAGVENDTPFVVMELIEGMLGTRHTSNATQHLRKALGCSRRWSSSRRQTRRSSAICSKTPACIQRRAC